MAWQINYAESVVKKVRKFSPENQKRLRNFLEERLASLHDPRSLGKALIGEYKIWRYRVGKYRILCEIKDSEIVILVVDIGHRSKIY